jgi:serine/threonine-protein kinase
LICGTPLYIAPECLDDPDNSSIQSDIYALGVVGFYLLTGRDLFVGDNPFHLFQQISQDVPPHVSDVIGDTVPAELNDLIARCVAKNPAERPASAREMLATVESLAATHVWTQSDAHHWWQTHDPQITMGTSCNAEASIEQQA